MNNKILRLSGIERVDNNNRITLTDDIEAEIKELLVLEEKYKKEPFYKKCIYCHHHIEAMNDYCEILDKKTLCFDLCDQFEKKMTVEEAEALDYFNDLEVGDE